jgi:hypothetical protein
MTGAISVIAGADDDALHAEEFKSIVTMGTLEHRQDPVYRLLSLSRTPIEPVVPRAHCCPGMISLKNMVAAMQADMMMAIHLYIS